MIVTCSRSYPSKEEEEGRKGNGLQSLLRREQKRGKVDVSLSVSHSFLSFSLSLTVLLLAWLIQEEYS